MPAVKMHQEAFERNEIWFRQPEETGFLKMESKKVFFQGGSYEDIYV
jgi:hypothetical protein